MAFRPFRITIALLTVVVLGAGTLTARASPPTAPSTPSTAQDKRGTAEPPVLKWTPCSGTFQCAGARVPADHSAPRGPTLGVGLIKMPVRDPARRIGTLFVSTGVVGGVSFVQAAGPSLLADLNQRFDIVGIDQRGTGTSEPAMRCSTYEQDRQIEKPLVADHSGAREQFVRQARALNDLCVQRGGPLLRKLGTTEAAHDLDLLRRAVGDRQLNFLGLSYGTLLGQYYAAQYPGRVRTMVLDGVQPADLSVRDPLRLDREMFAAAEAGLKNLFDWCRRTPDSCRFGDGAPEAAFDTLVRRLDANLTTHPGRHDLVTGGVLLGEAFQALAEPALWSAFAARLSQLSAAPLPTRALPSGENAVLAGYLGNTCVDQETPPDLTVHDRHARAAAEAAPRIGRFGAYAQVKCGLWPVESAHHRGPWTHQGDTPLLVVNNTRDPYAPRAWAKKILRDTGNARLLDVRGPGHLAFGRSACVNKAVIGYLTDIRLPARGSNCSTPLPN
ncbi:alpha/beta hydrolase [Streptomyces albipurpureus]|uniref:Alpha/beta hydrolase n=1 Tax=Streptomyces albipurpureus TaxID=2897419 RepID=A0ABT0UK48_9ACTN|nr:alpha/beta hydrolase [Streptomyces sp. CWNU-1]MCM2387970.1 alpha/beta hydrolase [Streptomyces sp. CWNU-1]